MTLNPLTLIQQFLERNEEMEDHALLPVYDYSQWTRLSDLERMVIRDMYKEQLTPISPHTIKAFWERKGIEVHITDIGN